MLDTSRCAQFAIIEQAIVVVRVNPAERQDRRECPFGWIGTTGSVAREHKISDITVLEVVME